MNINKLKEELMKEIEAKRAILNKMMVEEEDKGKILKFSEELDELIGRYHKLDIDIDI